MRLAAEQGRADAQTNLGISYNLGEGVEKDDEQAVHWFQLAAKQGYAIAQSNLAAAYRRGEGIEKDDEQAVHWCMSASYSAGGASPAWALRPPVFDQRYAQSARLSG